MQLLHFLALDGHQVFLPTVRPDQENQNPQQFSL
jgi:hypothetical protein